MRIIQPGSGMGSPASTAEPPVQQGHRSAFHARLGATGSAPFSIPGGPLPTGADVLQQTFQDMRELLRLQYQLSTGTTSLISNIMKTRHETARNSIQNIR
jgi:hypothetical protein